LLISEERWKVERHVPVKLRGGGGVGGCLPKSKHRSLWLLGGSPFLATSLAGAWGLEHWRGRDGRTRYGRKYVRKNSNETKA